MSFLNVNLQCSLTPSNKTVSPKGENFKVCCDRKTKDQHYSQNSRAFFTKLIKSYCVLNSLCCTFRLKNYLLEGFVLFLPVCIRIFDVWASVYFNKIMLPHLRSICHEISVLSCFCFLKS